MQSAVSWLIRRKLLAVSKESVAETPRYTVLSPWEGVRSTLPGSRPVRWRGRESSGAGVRRLFEPCHQLAWPFRVPSVCNGIRQAASGGGKRATYRNLRLVAARALLRHRENIQSALSGIGSMNRRESPVVSYASIPLDSRLTRVDLPHDPLRFWF